MSHSFIQEFKVEKNIQNIFNALSNFENLASMLDKNPLNAHFIPFITTAENKVYFYTTVLGKRCVVSMNRGDNNFNNAVHHNPTEIVDRIIKRCFNKFVNNISNPKMVAYSVSATTGIVSNVVNLHQDNNPFVSITH